MSEEQKKKECYDRFTDFVSYSIMAGVCIGMPLSHASESSLCMSPMVNWLCIQGGVYLAACLRNILVIMAIFCSKNPKSAKSIVDVCYLCLVLNFQFAWLIYGNTFHYSDENQNCRNLNSTLNSLWILEMIIIATGYLYFFGYGLVCCIISCFCCMLCTQGRSGQMDQMVDRVPYMAAVSSLNKKEFKDVSSKSKNMTECVICMNDFKEDDQIAELKCDERHYFHSACLEDWLKRKLECPLCKKPVAP